MSDYSLPANLHSSILSESPPVLIQFPAPAGTKLEPVRMTPQAQVAVVDLADALRAAGYLSIAVHPNTPARLVESKLVFEPGRTIDLYAQCLALSGHPGVWYDEKHAIQYFHRQPNFDTSLSTVRRLGQPGLFLPYAIALMAKSFSRKPRLQFADWADVFSRYLALINTPADYAERLEALNELFTTKVLNGSYATMPVSQLQLIEAAINWTPPHG